MNIVFFALFSGIISMSFYDMNDLLEKLQEPKNIFSIFAIPLSIILEGIINDHIKAVLVFWKLKYPLPASRAFSEIALKDPRIDINKLSNLYSGKLPDIPREQNQKWYALYRKCSDEKIVFDAHKSFLLTRDYTALTIVLIPICIVAHLVSGTAWQQILWHVILLIGMFLICSIAAQNYGKRFVANVLVEASN